MQTPMPKKAKKKTNIFHDPWPTKYPNGKKALLKALEKAAKSGVFDVEEYEKERLKNLSFND